jgi:dTDP-glucose 4,6-dehydratase
VIVTICSNDYGPYQFREKLIPLMVVKALNGEPMPVYGTGDNVCDWLFVEDHASALRLMARRGRVGGTQTISGECEQTYLRTVERLCALLDGLLPDSPHRPHDGPIRFVDDRSGRD